MAEDAELAFQREIEEETGIKEVSVLGIADYDIWYYGEPRNSVCGIAKLIDMDVDSLRLSEEHDEARWITEDEIENFEFQWPNAKRMVRKGFELNRLLKNGK